MAFNKVKALQEAEKLVGEGNVTLAIRHYLQIIEREPTDYILLNTVGDLYLREKNVVEALRHFNKLADTYTREGFTVKAIAIYKKIQDRKSTRLNSSHDQISYAVFCLKKKKRTHGETQTPVLQRNDAHSP